MKNKKGFISSTVVYSFFAIVVLLMSASLMTYVVKRKLTSELKVTAEAHKCYSDVNEFYVDDEPVSFAAYSKVCSGGPICGDKETYGDYYDKSGNKTTEAIYNSQCPSNGAICSTSANTFVGLDGNSHSNTGDNYDTYCKKCSYIGNNYYYMGKPVKKDEYDSESMCKSAPTEGITCYQDSTGYYINGENVPLADYNAKCNNGNNSCKYIDNAYHDIAGNIVSSKSEQLASCSCQKNTDSNGVTTYYNAAAVSVSKTDYNTQCSSICSANDSILNCALKVNYIKNNSGKTYDNPDKATDGKYIASTDSNKKIFQNTSTEVNTIYKTTDTGTGNTYYYRGAEDYNYVTFAGLKWRIVNMNSSGGIKLILDDTSVSLSSKYLEPDTNLFGQEKTKRYNVGLMHSNSKTLNAFECYNDKWANKDKSDILNYLYDFYKSYIATKSLDNKLINNDTIFIADKNISKADENSESFCKFLYNKNNLFSNAANDICNKNSTIFSYVTTEVDYFSGLERVMNPSKATIGHVDTGTAASTTDSFIGRANIGHCSASAQKYLSEYSVNKSNSSIGRAKLDYSIGLLTSDEAMYAGLDLYYSQGQFTKKALVENLANNAEYNYSTNSYLNNGQNFWLATAALIDKNATQSKKVYSTVLLNGNITDKKGIYYFAVDSKGGLKIADSDDTLSVRPVIVVKNTTICDSTQDGSSSHPFTLKGSSDCQ